MDVNKLKEELEGLWKENSGDSPEYLKLVLDNLLTVDSIVYAEEDGKLSSAILTVPYTFSCKEGKELNGLYLYGLPNLAEKMPGGKTAELLEKVCERAKAEGYHFAFICDCKEGLRDFLSGRNFHDAFYKVEAKYVHGHKFAEATAAELSIYGDEAEEEVTKFLTEYERQSLAPEGIGAFTILHSAQEWKISLRKVGFSGGKIYLLRQGDNIMAVAIAGTSHGVTEGRELFIEKIAAVNKRAQNELLAKMELMEPDKNITVCWDVERYMASDQFDPQLWSPFFAHNNPVASEYEDVGVVEEPFNPGLLAKPYGMIRILNVEGIIKQISDGNTGSLEGLDENDIIKMILRRPTAYDKDDTLAHLLQLPLLSLNAYNCL